MSDNTTAMVYSKTPWKPTTDDVFGFDTFSIEAGHGDPVAHVESWADTDADTQREAIGNLAIAGHAGELFEHLRELVSGPTEDLVQKGRDLLDRVESAYEALCAELGLGPPGAPSEEQDRAIELAWCLSRENCVKLLEGISIQCYDHEDQVTLREAVVENIKDGTIDPVAVFDIA